MIGAIIGDIVGSRFEFNNHLSKNFKFFKDDISSYISAKACRFTDDTVMTCAVAESLMRSAPNGYKDLSDVAVETMHEIGRHYPTCGYGGKFFHWMLGDDWRPYNSCGNGSAMRISAVGDVASSVEEAKQLAHAVTAITHNHPEGLKGAEAAAVAKVLLKQGMSKEDLRRYIESNYYELPMTVKEYREACNGHGKEICQVTMPQAFTCFFEGESFEDVIRNCISIGGDSDTIAAIAGGIAEAYYPVPDWMKFEARCYLSKELLYIVDKWDAFLRKGGIQCA